MITFEHQFEALPVIEIRCDFCFSIQGNHVCVCVIKYTHTHIYIYIMKDCNIALRLHRRIFV